MRIELSVGCFMMQISGKGLKFYRKFEKTTLIYSSLLTKRKGFVGLLLASTTCILFVQEECILVLLLIVYLC